MRLLAAFVAMLLCASSAWAQSSVRPQAIVVPTCGTAPRTYPAGTWQTNTQDTNGNACVNATVSVSASIAGFAPATAGTPLAVTSTTGQEALPAGATVQVSNVGSNLAYVNFGTSGSVTATTSNLPIPGGSTVWITVGANTNIAAITGSSTTTLNLIGGSGLGTGMGGGGSGGGGGSLSATASATPTSVSAGNANLNVSLHSELFSALSFGGTPLALGQAAMASSIPVAIASNQAAIPVTPTPDATAAAAPAATAAGTGKPLYVSLNSELFTTLSFGGVPLSLGSAVSASSIPVVIASDQGQVAVNLPDGQANMAGSTPVVIASDQSPVSVKQPDVPNTGSVAAGTLNSAYALTLGGGVNSMVYNTSGLTGTTATITVEGSSNGGSSYAPVNGVTNPGGVQQSATTIDLNNFCVNVGGLGAVELLVTTAGTGATVNITATASVSQCPAPTVLTNVVGAVTATATLATANGWTPLLANALSTTVKAIKSSAGQLGMAQCYNPNSAQVYLQVFSVASGSVSLGTTAPKLSIPIAPTSTGGFALSNPGITIGGTGMSAAVTTTATGNTAPSTAADCNMAWN